jgi:D-alanyl-D-alanine carboxypeptidase/D-alanyl-D-alanine-endopeptidase (penicillin-binding protein 4)
MALVGAAPVDVVRPAASGEPWTASGIANLRRDLDTMLAADPAVSGAHVGVFALDTGSGTVLYDRSGADEFQPASTLKLLIGSVALEKLGSAYRFHTQLDRVGERLVLRAGGDPFLVSGDLDAAAQAVSASGMRSADGVSVDASRYDTPPYPAGWVWDDFAYDYAARVSAAAVDGNVTTLSVVPGSAVGDRVGVLSGGTPFIIPTMCPGLVNRATTGPANGAATIDTLTLAPDCAAIVGTLPLAAPSTSIAVAVRDPAESLKDTFLASLQAPQRAIGLGDAAADNGIAPGNEPPDGRLLWVHESQPLASWLGPAFWIPSDNFVAEQLLCELGYVVGGAPGSTGGGISAERAWLTGIGIDPATTTLADGSGLSQYDRITPRDLVAILQHDWNGPSRDLVLDSLPIGAVRGTIEGIAGTPAAGRVFAKTGSMSHVRGLAGYLATLRHGAVTFAFNVDDWNGDYAPLAALRARFLSRFITD